MADTDKGILVIGGTGRIGSSLRHFWPDGLARWSSRTGAPGCVRFDLLTQPGLARRYAQGTHTILCLAGVVPGRGAGSFYLNAKLACAAIRTAHQVGARVLLASSAAVYGDQPGCLHEGTAPMPITPYGRSKRAMEAQGLALAAHLGVPACALRIGNIAGFDGALGNWYPGYQLDHFAGQGPPKRSYIGIRTLANVLERLTCQQDLPPVLNIAERGCIDVADLMDAAGLGWRALPAPQGAIASVHLDTTRLQERIGPVAHADPKRLVREWANFRHRMQAA